MKSKGTRAVAPAVRPQGRVEREMVAARRALHGPQSDIDAALEGAAARVLMAISRRPRAGLRVHIRARRAITEAR